MKDGARSETIINGYNLELDTIEKDVKNHRNAMYVKNNLNYTREKKFEAINSSNICIKIDLNHILSLPLFD